MDTYTIAEAARREGDVALEMRALWSAADVDMAHLHLEQGREKILRVIDLAIHLDDPRTASVARQGAVFALLGLGDLEGARAHAAAMLTLARGARNVMVAMARTGMALMAIQETDAVIANAQYEALTPLRHSQPYPGPAGPHDGQAGQSL